MHEQATMGEVKKSEALFVRLEPGELERLDALAEKFPALGFSRSHVARIAMRLGLEAIQRDPMVLLQAPATKPARKRSRKKR